MRMMGLDYGTTTVGVAISDPLGLTAQGIETIHYVEHKKHEVYERLSELIRTYDVERIVVGLPKHMNGTEGLRAEASARFAKGLKRKFQLPVDLWDERLTTMEAERILLAADVSRKKRKKVIDKEAAVLILQNYLDKLRLEKSKL